MVCQSHAGDSDRNVLSGMVRACGWQGNDYIGSCTQKLNKVLQTLSDENPSDALNPNHVLKSQQYPFPFLMLSVF